MSARGLKTPAPKKAVAPPPIKANGKLNGNGSGHDDIDQEALLHALQAMRVGDFSVRLAADQAGIAGKIADTFNEIVAANERMAQQLERVGEVVGREGKTRQRVQLRPGRRRLGRDGELGQHADRRSAVADHRGDPRHHRRGARATCCRPCSSTSTAGRCKGEFLRSATIVNTMIKQLSACSPRK